MNTTSINIVHTHDLPRGFHIFQIVISQRTSSSKESERGRASEKKLSTDFSVLLLFPSTD